MVNQELRESEHGQSRYSFSTFIGLIVNVHDGSWFCGVCVYDSNTAWAGMGTGIACHMQPVHTCIPAAVG